jgi:hypothetical protein
MAVAEVIAGALAERELQFEQLTPEQFAVQLPGEKRLKTTCLLTIGEHALAVEAFVMRAPDENHLEVYRWLLQHNSKLYGVAWSIDVMGDVYLTGRVPLTAVSGDELDRVLGSVLEAADSSFNTLLQLGFGTAIRREWDWRVKNNESLANLQAFAEFAQRRST